MVSEQQGVMNAHTNAGMMQFSVDVSVKQWQLWFRNDEWWFWNERQAVVGEQSQDACVMEELLRGSRNDAVQHQVSVKALQAIGAWTIGSDPKPDCFGHLTFPLLNRMSKCSMSMDQNSLMLKESAGLFPPGSTSG